MPPRNLSKDLPATTRTLASVGNVASSAALGAEVVAAVAPVVAAEEVEALLLLLLLLMLSWVVWDGLPGPRRPLEAPASPAVMFDTESKPPTTRFL
eukprot:CAMPEP_0206626232 /NCGR_PEP_ID=MMETSP0325_2-20121206/65182_1 /ASSEMBLY_ACC=CAM_ASM_000347 /TAXON_ID=2866 /ORGANISM="Crypthecodinium cohnii, Strain Seligo" /LENGTH=95 /DNA_ID=CAMNT_0054150515 /DNA_START=693 /DNA_END=980 /DNA_ORIENTATION=-